ncbi:hypothetical protein IFM89_005642 [Coptis chinensis]|uniref:Protein FAR1-RELATED SEQUENCE n=1 Tax=Coptis chinensis TaxID=261450 RepID=A0A835ME93_9MAGN|nr:hypothetical protein IFM89_005642 [Coptis chinensis]
MQMWSVASEDESLYKIALHGLEKLFIGVLEEHDKLFRTPNTIDASMEVQKSQEDATTSCQIPILDPNISITVRGPKDGKSTHGRWKNPVEIAVTKKRKCSQCKSQDHDKRTCPKLKKT